MTERGQASERRWTSGFRGTSEPRRTAELRRASGIRGSSSEPRRPFASSSGGVGPIDWPERDFEWRDEPRVPPPSDPFFGDDACGQGARTVYEERRRQAPGLPRRGAYNDAIRFADYCRIRRPEFRGICSEAAERGWATCYAYEYLERSTRNPSSACQRAAEQARFLCRLSRVPFPHPRF